MCTAIVIREGLRTWVTDHVDAPIRAIECNSWFSIARINVRSISHGLGRGRPPTRQLWRKTRVVAMGTNQKKPPRDKAWRLFENLQGVFCETPFFDFYGVFTTTFGAGLLASICALTFWICAACSLSWAVRVSICFCCCVTVTCNFSTLRLSMACFSVCGT
jgi:hypothetical protein